MIQHKGAIRWDVTVHGRSAHSSQPELGQNAILGAVRVIEFLAHYEKQLGARFTNPWITGPTLTVTMIQGGRTRNAVPDECTFAVDFRILPGMDRQQSFDELLAALGSLDVSMSHSDFQIFAPALNTAANDPLVTAALAHCSETLGRKVTPTAAPYCSDACWAPSSVPSILLGPGDISTAHAVDECVDVGQIVQCADIYRRLVMRDWAG
jgi:acetylornithine deacetylase/succinyl-diaminopimelate desuccinylase-like protein